LSLVKVSFDLPNANAELLEMGLNIVAENSVAPVTVGVAQRPVGQVSTGFLYYVACSRNQIMIV